MFDPAEAFLAVLNRRSDCDLYIYPALCDGHYGVFGSCIVAQVWQTSRAGAACSNQ